MILQFKSELLLVIKHMSKFSPPFFLFFSPPLSYCHNHVISMLLLLLLHMKSLHWLTHYLQNKGHIHWPGIPGFLRPDALLFSLYFPLFLCHFLDSNQTRLSWCLFFHLCAHVVSISTQVGPLSGLSAKCGCLPEKPLQLGVLSTILTVISTFVYMSKDWNDFLFQTLPNFLGLKC